MIPLTIQTTHTKALSLRDAFVGYLKCRVDLESFCYSCCKRTNFKLHASSQVFDSSHTRTDTPWVRAHPSHQQKWLSLRSVPPHRLLPGLLLIFLWKIYFNTSDPFEYVCITTCIRNVDRLGSQVSIPITQREVLSKRKLIPYSLL
jgi:hypothetical protein